MTSPHTRILPALLLAGACLPLRAAELPTGLDDRAQLAPVAAESTAPFSYARLQNGVQLRVNGLVKNILFHAPDIVRVNTNLGRSHATHPSLGVVLKPGEVNLAIEDAPGSLTIASKALRVRVDTRSGALEFLRPDGSVLSREQAPSRESVQERMISDAPTYEVRQGFELAPQESLYGLGQYDKRYMDYRGQAVNLVQTNIGIVIPFLVSTQRYGLLWDSYAKSTFKDDASGATFWSESSPAGVDYYLIAGETMDGVIAGYRRLTGAAPLLPKTALGLFMSKERYRTQDRLVEVVREFRKDGFPLDNIVQDWQYWGGDKDGTWSGMIWNQERFPDPVGLTRTLHDELKVKLMISIWPSVGNDTELARELDAQGLRFKPLHWISKKARIYDAFSDEGRAIYFKHVKKGLLDVGVDALWMDGTEVEVGGACHNPAEVEADIKSLGKNALGDFTRYLNTYSLMTTRGTYEGQRATSDKRVLTLTRSAYTGQQRYSAVSWSGDTTASWGTFRDQISGGLNVALAGQPYWTQDTGGFFVRGGRGHADAAYRELFARWHQFGALNPLYRIHGTDIEREPYSFREVDPEVYASLRDAAHLRYRLIPYLYALAWQSTDQGYTMMRALPLEFPDDLRARKIDDQFLVGPSLLAHPVTRAMFRVPPPPATTIPAEALTTEDGRPGLVAHYFEGTNFERAAGTEINTTVDLSWPGPPLTSPPPGLTSCDNFSGRWTGFLTIPEDGTYEIGAEADDGLRLWLDGTLIAEDWTTHAQRFAGGKLTLRKGQKLALRMDYFQGTGGRGLRLCWRTPAQLAAPPPPVEDTLATYLPAGAGWYDFWTNERFTGGTEATRACPLNRFPLYVRAGSILPLSPVMQHVNERPDAPYEIRVYPGADAAITLYEDDGETYAYERGERATVQLRWNDKSRTLSIGARAGAFLGLVRERDFRIVLASPANAGLGEVAQPDRTVRYDGKPVELTF